MQAQQFTNFSNEDFTWNYNGMAYTFKSGQTMFLEDYKAEHFAKHLIDRELNKMGIATNMEAKRKELLVKCFPTDEVVTPLEALNIEETKKVTKKKAKVVEVEFEDLKSK
jgi:hypothetical protein